MQFRRNRRSVHNSVTLALFKACPEPLSDLSPVYGKLNALKVGLAHALLPRNKRGERYAPVEEGVLGKGARRQTLLKGEAGRGTKAVGKGCKPRLSLY